MIWYCSILVGCIVFMVGGIYRDTRRDKRMYCPICRERRGYRTATINGDNYHLLCRSHKKDPFLRPLAGGGYAGCPACKVGSVILTYDDQIKDLCLQHQSAWSRIRTLENEVFPEPSRIGWRIGRNGQLENMEWS